MKAARRNGTIRSSAALMPAAMTTRVAKMMSVLLVLPNESVRVEIRGLF
jgi:hypothetical protein